MIRVNTAWLVLVALLTAAGCAASNQGFDTGPRDTGTPDTATADQGVPDSTVGMDAAPDVAIDVAPDLLVDVRPDVACPDGGSACGTSCTDLRTDPTNCGRCGVACGAAQLCHVGSCVANPCPSNQTPCSVDAGATVCVNLNSDVNNCGVCGTVCPATNECAAGTCLPVCTTGQVHCGATCVTLATDAMNCGTCGRACGSGQTCTGGTCVCAAPALACGAVCVTASTDVNNCGSCGHACTAGQYCQSSTCILCAPRTLCPSGLCTDTNTDRANCGACGTACSGAEVCTGGTCTCPTGAMVCSGVCANLLTDGANCGACGRACPTGQFCSAGVCSTMITGYMQVASPAGVTFRDACGAPGAMTYLSPADDSSALVPLPFPFRYWSASLAAGAMINICSNGWIGMDGVAGNSLGGSVPSASAPNAVIAAHWGDNYNNTPNGQCVATFGTAPNRQWVVEWNDDYYCCSRGAGVSLTYEIILSESTNTIDLVYRTMSGARAQTMGLENQTGTLGVNACPGGTGSCIPTAGQVVRFVPM